jgi:hypothetical protein
MCECKTECLARCKQLTCQSRCSFCRSTTTQRQAHTTTAKHYAQAQLDALWDDDDLLLTTDDFDYGAEQNEYNLREMRWTGNSEWAGTDRRW